MRRREQGPQSAAYGEGAILQPYADDIMAHLRWLSATGRGS